MAIPDFTPISPLEQMDFNGHSAALAELHEGLYGQRMHHAWLISGPEGVGKATLAYRAARALLAGVESEDFSLPAEHPVMRRMLAGAHADLLVIEPAFDEKKQESKREIGVDAARQIASFLSLTPAEAPLRVVIIDPADGLTTSAANAILKILEEPPPRAVIFLISHQPGRLLPTIRSRCRNLRLHTLSEATFNEVVRGQLPMEAASLHTLYQLSEGAPGLGLQMQAFDALTTLEAVSAVLTSLPQPDESALLALAQPYGGKTLQLHGRWQVLAHITLFLLAEAAISRGGEGLPPSAQQAITRLAQLHSSATLARLHSEAGAQFSLAAKAHLDYKSALISLIYHLAKPEIAWKTALTS